MAFLNREVKLNVERIYEILPGLLIWILLLSPIWAGFSIPIFIINLMVVLSVYWLYRSLLTAIGTALGYRQYIIDKKKNWLEECLKLKRSELSDQHELPVQGLLPKYLIVFAHYGETYEVLKRSLNGILAQNYPKELIYISVSIESRRARKDPVYADRESQLRKDFGEVLGNRLMFFTHPDNIPGEAVGAASNRAWGTKNAVDQLEKQGEDISKFLITAPDGDLLFHREYLAASVYKWLISKKRNQKFYQTALYTFNNNYWEVPLLIRILSISLTLPVLASSIFEKHKRETWSCYTVNLKVMKEVNYWDTSLAIDDTTFYWRPYFYFQGDWECEVFFIPLSADAVYDSNYIQNHKAQYKQYLRWGWGVITVPIAMKILLKRDLKINIFERISKLFHLFQVFVFWKVFAFLLSFGIPIVLLINYRLNDQVIVYTAPQIVSTTLGLATLLLIPTTIFKILIIPRRPKKMGFLKYLFLLIIEAPLNIVSLFTFSFLPFIEATTRMMLGQEHATTIKWSEKTISA